MTIKNCWEFHQCGREVGGNNSESLGICPASSHTASDGTNRGHNAGRYCWRITGTYCTGSKSGQLADKVENCGDCEFFKLIICEEGVKFTL